MAIDVDGAIARYNGQWNISFDGNPANAGQCVQLVAAICRDNGLPVEWADAAYWFLNFSHPEAYDKVANDPNNAGQVPEKGDIIIWNTNLPNSGGAGHIAVVVSTQPGSFVSFDSNWGGKYAHLVTHNWSYVLGWLHPKSAAPAPPVQGDEMIANADQAAKVYALLRPNGGGSADEINGSVGTRSFASFLEDAQPEVQARDAGLRDQATRLQELSGTINQLNQTVTDVTTKEGATEQDLKDALTKVSDLTSELSTAHDQIAELANRPVPQIPVTTWQTVVTFLTEQFNKVFKKG